MTKKIISLSIATICLLAFFFFFVRRNFESALIGFLGAYCAVEVIPRLNEYRIIKKSAKEGVNTIREEGICTIKGLRITIAEDKETKDLLVVSNSPTWIYKIQTDDLDEQLGLLISGFDILRKNKDWNAFIANKTVCFNLYSDESFEKEIVKISEKQYV